MFGVGQSSYVVAGENCANPGPIAKFHSMSSERESPQDVAAGTRLYLWASLTNSRSYPTMRSCSNLVSFVSMPGERYTFRQLVQEKSCTVQVVQESDKLAPSTFQFHPAKACS